MRKLSLGFAANLGYSDYMSFKKPLPKAMFTDPNAPKRLRRAEALRKRALSPVRILFMVLMLPVTTAVIALGVYIRISDFEDEEAVLHLIALAGCEAAEAVVPGPFYAGMPGYHPRNDPDGDGIACESDAPAPVEGTPPQQSEAPAPRAVGNAKFVRP